MALAGRHIPCRYLFAVDSQPNCIESSVFVKKPGKSQRFVQVDGLPPLADLTRYEQAANVASSKEAASSKTEEPWQAVSQSVGSASSDGSRRLFFGSHEKAQEFFESDLLEFPMRSRANFMEPAAFIRQTPVDEAVRTLAEYEEREKKARLELKKRKVDPDGFVLVQKSRKSAAAPSTASASQCAQTKGAHSQPSIQQHPNFYSFQKSKAARSSKSN
jgi:hypothetical protein